MRLVLPSNSSFSHFPNNTIVSFTVQLPQSLDLTPGLYECGLAEIQFFKSWYNIQDCNITFKVDDVDSKIEIKDGYYASEIELIEAINCEILNNDSVKDLFEFGYNNANKFCHYCYTGKLDVKLEVILSNSLAKIINLQEDKITTSFCNGTSYRLNYNTPMRLHSIFNLMVYTDIIESSLVGDIQSPLLRVVHVEDGHWKVQCTSYNKIQYFKINRSNIRSISVYIYTDYGEKVPFTSGRCMITLDIRRVKPIELV